MILVTGLHAQTATCEALSELGSSSCGGKAQGAECVCEATSQAVSERKCGYGSLRMGGGAQEPPTWDSSHLLKQFVDTLDNVNDRMVKAHTLKRTRSLTDLDDDLNLMHEIRRQMYECGRKVSHRLDCLREENADLKECISELEESLFHGESTNEGLPF
mmetsp:Transcript_9054/g.27206  ORF Transcript_9054/g.27206 Transcript_9054/m.27206 type:complete len:159 (-) Transcript_9054:197-673(-)|eukprot:CAMPEP_0198727280 /NCGR_PEP_ID=MMETSP1475-20131203/4049_1 /TAXON_ID= ORGANISM="Unidentified sp., Strain CCMP1999" /NCGR_SAMPLE_ID=MMETSP1475 /ASSEMBLY_ACC=CAM_ASM_001111 /LENGTH=158 /DNA_ID=CAMNT_0044489293 /DNA_START=77 /DNA_END=553 /DNA_ORIENTATION=+